MAGQGVPISEAAMQFFVEAIRANTEVLRGVGETQRLVQEEAKEQLRLITDVRERVIRIEATPRVTEEISELRGKVQILENAEVARSAKAATWTWIVRYVPTLAGIIVTIIASVLIILVTSGRVVIPPPSGATPSQLLEQRPTDPQ
jgi:hypothetical protein